MQNDKDWEDDYQPEELAKRFEAMIKDNRFDYFDSSEFDVIVDFFLQKNDLEKSRLALDMALDQHPNDNDLLIKLARQLVAENNPNKGMEILKKVTIPSEDTDYYLTLGSAYAALSNPKLAISAYKKALSSFEEDEREELYNAIAFEYENLKEYDTALTYLKKAVPLSTNLEAQYYEIRFCYSILDETDEAIEYFNNEIEKNVYNIEARMALALSYTHIDLIEKAIDALEFVLAIDPTHTKAYVELCTLLLDLDRTKEAFDNIQEALRNHVDTAMIRAMMGDCYMKSGDDISAQECYMLALSMDDKNVEAYIGLGFVFSDRGNNQKAINYFERAIKLDPLNTDVIYYLAEENNKLGRYEEAFTYLHYIEEINPFDEDLYIHLMDTYLYMDNPDEAIKSLNDGLKTIGESAPLIYRLAYVFFICNEHAAGMLNLQKALELDIDGADDFLELNSEFLTADNEILELIDEQKKKQSNLK